MNRVFPGLAERGERTTVSVTFALFVCSNLICANATVERQKLCSLRFAEECPNVPFQVLTPIGGLPGICTALTPCRTAGTRTRYERLCREWQEFHAIPPTRPKPRMRFQSRHSYDSGCNAYEPSIATVLISSDISTRSFDIPSDLLFLPTEPPEAPPDTTMGFQPQFVPHLYCFFQKAWSHTPFFVATDHRQYPSCHRQVHVLQHSLFLNRFPCSFPSSDLFQPPPPFFCSHIPHIQPDRRTNNGDGTDSDTI